MDKNKLSTRLEPLQRRDHPLYDLESQWPPYPRSESVAYCGRVGPLLANKATGQLLKMNFPCDHLDCIDSGPKKVSQLLSKAAELFRGLDEVFLYREKWDEENWEKLLKRYNKRAKRANASYFWVQRGGLEGERNWVFFFISSQVRGRGLPKAIVKPPEKALGLLRRWALKLPGVDKARGALGWELLISEGKKEESADGEEEDYTSVAYGCAEHCNEIVKEAWKSLTDEEYRPNRIPPGSTPTKFIDALKKVGSDLVVMNDSNSLPVEPSRNLRSSREKTNLLNPGTVLME